MALCVADTIYAQHHIQLIVQNYLDSTNNNISEDILNLHG